MEKFKFLKREQINQLPKTPGVYAFRKGAKLLYIGKANDLQERVKHHQELLGLAKQLGYIKTDSEIEALVLEANLIKKHQPKYNVIWRDDKNYFFIGITKEIFPRIFITHQKKAQNLKRKTKNHSLKTKTLPLYVGPFVDGKALKQTLTNLRKVFPYRTCKTLPKHPCLWYQLNRCPAPCLLKSGLVKQVPNFQNKIKKENQKNTKNLLKILQGKKNQVLRNSKEEMKSASKHQDYEKAAKIRDQIKALEIVLAHARIFEPQNFPEANWSKTQKILQKILKTKKEISRIEAYDISNIQGKEATGSMITFLNGQPDKNFYRKFKIKIAGKPNDVAMIKEVLSRRLRHPEWALPDLILIDGGKAQLNAALQCLTPGVKHLKIIALAKRKNELFIEGRKKPILLKSLPREIFNLILQLRDESHRFAISYHRKLREVSLLKK